jgi:hypothetical protein
MVSSFCQGKIEARGFKIPGCKFLPPSFIFVSISFMIQFRVNQRQDIEAGEKMSGSCLQRRVWYFHNTSALLVALQCFLFFAATAFAADCEILRQDMFERAQSAIVTDWNAGIPYRRLETEVYPCARLLIRNNGWLGVYSTDIEVTATFNDESTKSKRVEDEKKRIEPGEQYTASVCFESGSGISKLECRFR